MKITIVRDVVSNQCVQGSVYVDGILKGYSLERPYDLKAGISQKMSCIPVGLYDIALQYSKSFKKQKIHVLRIQNRAGILIHEGNTVNESKGCILAGRYRKHGWVLESKHLITELEAAVYNAEKRGEKVELEIVDISKKERG